MRNVFDLSFRIYRVNADDNSVTIIIEDFRGANVYIRCPAVFEVLVAFSKLDEEALYKADWSGRFGVTYQKGIGTRLHLLALK